MESRRNWEPALNPEDLARFFVQRANAADVDGLVALFESGAVLAIAEGEVARGSEAIRAFYTKLLADKPAFEPGQQRPALRQGELALTSTRLTNGTVTAAIARQQPDGTWLWIIDQPVIAKNNRR
jgi:ketosteroid isomerase-like protein